LAPKCYTGRMNDSILPILKSLQSGQADLQKSVEDLRGDINMQFAALNKKLTGQLISEVEFRGELNELRERLQTVERRLQLLD